MTLFSKHVARIALAAALALGALGLVGCSSEKAPSSLADTGSTDATAVKQAPEPEPVAELTEDPDEPDASANSNDTPAQPNEASAQPAAEPEAPAKSADAEPEQPATEPAEPAVTPASTASSTEAAPLEWKDLPAFDGNPYVYVNDGEPAFDDIERTSPAGTERYDDWDELGRCTYTFAVVGPETQPTEKRGSIGNVRPSGWRMAKYDFVDGKYLYNRCHLLGYQLTGENANLNNLITGTRYLNVQGMLPFENAVDDYIDATGNHVLMRVTPVFEGEELVARGVQMQAESVEDDGDGISFNVFCYNVQPGVAIDYATGESEADGTIASPDDSDEKGSGKKSGKDGSSQSKGGSSQSANSKGSKGSSTSDNSKNKQDYVLNTNTKKFHIPSCSSVKQMADKNREDVKDTRENILNRGYDPCKRCNP